MKWLALAIIIGLLFTLSVPIYDAGYNAAMRECPPAQQDQRLLRSEQTPSGTLCFYASGWDSYGRAVTVRKVLQ